MNPRRLENGEEGKFWEAWIKDELTFCYRFGKIGAPGGTKLKKLGTGAEAQAELEKKLNEKLAQGYVELGAEGDEEDEEEKTDDGDAAEAEDVGGPAAANDDRRARMKTALRDIRLWMRANGAPLLSRNLAPGASRAQLDAIEAAVGGTLPGDLRLLWSIHDGQREDGNGFIEILDFIGSRHVVSVRESVLKFVTFLRENRDGWAEAGITAAEVRSNHWVPIASRDSDSMVVSGTSGRVFSSGKVWPPLRLVSASLLEWLEAYAGRVTSGYYRVTEGFGDYYLTRDYSWPHTVEEPAEPVPSPPPPLSRYQQLREALERNDAARCAEIIDAARFEPHSVPVLVRQMFEARPDPRLLAVALRAHVRTAELTPDQWVDVAVGGGLIENNAVRDVAAARSAGASRERVEALAAAVEAASGQERDRLALVLSKVSASLTARDAGR